MCRARGSAAVHGKQDTPGTAIRRGALERICFGNRLDALSSAEQALIATSPEDAEVAELRSAMLALHPAYREPLVLQVIMGFSADEIAGVMGLKRGAVLTRLCRARKTLAERLNGKALDGEEP